MQNQKISKSFIDLNLIHNFCNANISYFLLFKLIKYFLLNKERESSINFQGNTNIVESVESSKQHQNKILL